MSTAAKVGTPNAPRVVVGRLERVRRGKRTAFDAVVSKPTADTQPDRVALTLALAHAVQRTIAAGEIRDQAEAARKLGTTRARITQILDLTRISPRIQEAILDAEMVDGQERVSERRLRQLLRCDSWASQDTIWAATRAR